MNRMNESVSNLIKSNADALGQVLKVFHVGICDDSLARSLSNGVNAISDCLAKGPTGIKIGQKVDRK